MVTPQVKKNAALILALGIIAVIIFYLEDKKPAPAHSRAPETLATSSSENQAAAPSTREDIRKEKAGRLSPAVEIAAPSGFINADRVALKDLVGKKVMLVDFWTYSCINCQRTIPYLNAWYEKYQDKGFIVIGVHTPEFEFEKKLENVKKAAANFGIKYPIVLDNEYGTWEAYHNRYWPHKYLIDIDGFIAYDHIGEGGYGDTEKKIQELLTERMQALGMKEVMGGTITSPSDVLAVDFSKVKSPETYFGSLRNEYLANGTPGKEGVADSGAPKTPEKNRLYLVGSWDIHKEYASAHGAGAKVMYRYDAKSVYLVARSEKPVKFRVVRDGKLEGSWQGRDLKNKDEKGLYGIIQDDRLYRIIEDPGGYGEHTLEIIIEEPGVQLFAFTFG